MSATPLGSSIVKPVHKCPFCSRSFCSATNKQRHMNSAHHNENILMPPAPDTDEESDENGGQAPASSGNQRPGAGQVMDVSNQGCMEDNPSDAVVADDAVQGYATVAVAASNYVNETAEEFRTRALNDGVARGSLAGPRPTAGAMRRHVFLSSIAARIQDYYEHMPEASLSVPVVPSTVRHVASKFSGMTMRKVLKFVVSAGGTGLSRGDQQSLAEVMYEVESLFDYEGVGNGIFKALFPTPASFSLGVRMEQNKVLSRLGWMQTPIVVNGQTSVLYYRDLLQTAVDAVRSATSVDLEGGALSNAADGSRRRSSFLNSDLFIKDAASIRVLHGERARPLFANLHADEALVSWSGAHYMFPIRAEFPSVDGGGRWVTVAHVPHLERPVEQGSRVQLAASDGRNDLLQRCFAVLLRRFVRASERGYPVDIPNVGKRLLVARIGGVVADLMEERAIYALGGTRSTFICTHCRVNRAVCCAPDAADAHPRDVVETLEAQFYAAKQRARDPRVSLRAPLTRNHSALAFVPALGAVHGLSTGNLNYFRVVSFDLLHVWKLGVLRTLAQRLPAFLKAVCTRAAGARMGTVQQSLDVLNLRGFQLGRRCRVSPAPPGCFVSPNVKQATMNGRSWRHFVVFWPHMVAGLVGPADPERLRAVPAPSAPIDEEAEPTAAAADVDVSDYFRSDDGDEEDLPAPKGFQMGEGTDYHALFGDMPVEDAVQEMYCQAAELSGRFFRDNTADVECTTGTEVASMVAAAVKLGRCIQVLLGPVHTSKLHRLMFHLGAELQNKGNLWHGDTSVNESLHKVCKRMYARSNKRGPTLAMQMMRGEESQAEILRGLEDGNGGDDDSKSDDEELTEQLNAARDAHVHDVASIPAVVLQMSTRGIRVSVQEVVGLPGMADLPELLDADVATTITVAKTLKFVPRFEWTGGSGDVVQYLRATSTFNGAPWYDYMRYLNADNEVCWGQARMVLRRVGSDVRHCVVVWRMRKADPRPGCVLTSHGCQRLAWDVPTPDSMWPTTDIVDVEQILRLENVLPDWRDLADRRGIDAMVSDKFQTAEERRQARFFTNAFYPWTSRGQSG